MGGEARGEASGGGGDRAGRADRDSADRFPKASNHNDSALKEISWEEFFEKFDKSGLALVYQEVTKEGAESNFNKLVHPENAPASAKKSAKKVAKKGG